MGSLRPDAKIIYESPDKGGTVYGRYAGTNERWLVGYSHDSESTKDQIKDNQLWQDIRTAAKTNPALQKALSHAILIYRLSKDKPL